MVTRSESLSGNRQFGAKLDLFVADHDVAALLTGTPRTPKSCFMFDGIRYLSVADVPRTP